MNLYSKKVLIPLTTFSTLTSLLAASYYKTCYTNNHLNAANKPINAIAVLTPDNNSNVNGLIFHTTAIKIN
jgi:hypothetical protein